MIVVDTNIMAYLWLPGEFSQEADTLLQQDADWAAPSLWRSEFLSVLAGYMRKGVLGLDQACLIMHKAQKQLEDREFVTDPEHVLNLVHQSSCSSYDCEFVALAQALQVPLVTFDRRILKNFPETSISIQQYL